MSTLNTASNYIEKINSSYPVPGKPNDTQGFRDNFKNIKLSLESFDEDIYNLKINSVRLDNISNDFNENTIKRAALQDCSVIVHDTTANIQTGDVVINYRNGNFQKFVIGDGLHTFSVINWPEGNRSGSIIVAVTATTTTSLVSFSAQNVYNLGRYPLPIGLFTENPYVFELWNGGDTESLYVRQILPEGSYESIYELVKPINLKKYTESELLALSPVEDGAMAFLQDNYNTLVYHTSGTWYAVNASPLPTYINEQSTYSIKTLASDTLYEESSSVTFLVQTTNVNDGTKLYWTTIMGSGITAGDFLDNQLSGVITIKSGSATITRVFTPDNITEEGDNFSIQIRRDGITGAVVTTSNAISILDIVSPDTITLEPYDEQINLPEVAYTGTSISLEITGGVPNTTFTIVETIANNNMGMYALGNEGTYTQQNFPLNEGTYTFVLTFAGTGNIRTKNVTVNP